MSTAEHFNTSISVNITVLDADDQYPQFLPCVLLYQDETSRICTSPVYTVNVTEGEEVTAYAHTVDYTHHQVNDTPIQWNLFYPMEALTNQRLLPSVLNRQTNKANQQTNQQLLKKQTDNSTYIQIFDVSLGCDFRQFDIKNCPVAGHHVGLLSWTHTCGGWRQSTQLPSQLCHPLRCFPL